MIPAVSEYLWTDKNKMAKCLPLITACIEEGNKDIRKMATQIVGLLPFEVWLMEEKGLEMTYFDYMNAYHPAGRRYEKDGKTITLGFGCNGVKFYFYFGSGNFVSDYKSVPYKREEFEAALNGQTENIV